MEPYRVAIIADAHIDPLYEAFGVANCDEPVCCRKGQTAAKHFEYRTNIDESVIKQTIVNDNGKVMLDLSMAPKIRELKKSTQTRYLTNRNDAPAGYWGDYRKCDTPIWAVDNVIDEITESHKVYYHRVSLLRHCGIEDDNSGLIIICLYLAEHRCSLLHWRHNRPRRMGDHIRLNQRHEPSFTTENKDKFRRGRVSSTGNWKP